MTCVQKIGHRALLGAVKSLIVSLNSSNIGKILAKNLKKSTQLFMKRRPLVSWDATRRSKAKTRFDFDFNFNFNLGSLRFIRLFAFCFLFVAVVQGWSSPLILDSGYFEKPLSHRAVKNFTLSWLGVQSSLFDSLSFPYLKQRPWLYLGTGLLTSVYLQQFVGDVAYHEFAHQLRFESLGLKSQYENKGTRFFNYFLYRLFSEVKSWGSVSVVMDEKADKTDKTDKTGPVGPTGLIGPTDKCVRLFGDNHWNRPYLNTPSSCLNALGGLWMSSSGLNYQMTLASELGKRVHLGEGHVYEWITHFVNRYSIGLYDGFFDSIYGSSLQSGNDIKNIIANFENLGISVSAQDLKIRSLLSLTLSSSTWAYFISMYRFLKTGDTKVPAPIYRGFWLPDIETYIVNSGLSYRISTGYQLNKETHFPFYFEFITGDKLASEVSFGYFGKFFGRWEVELLINVSNRVDGSLEFLKDWGDGLYMGLGIEHRDIENFFGERYIGSLQEGSFETSSWVNLKWKM